MQKEFKLNLNGLTCGSCELLIERIAGQNNARVKSIDPANGRLVVEIEEGSIGALKQQLAEKGFNERDETTGALQRGELSNVTRYLAGLLAGEDKFYVESRLLSYAIGSMAVLILFFSLFYANVLKDLRNSAEYLPLVFLSIVISVVSVFSHFHITCYRKSLSCTCTNGMMAGMVAGMFIGLVAGMIIGATNGMFIGSVAGVVFGILLGADVGRYSGVMGALEGILAGLMAGTMGAMLSVMTINDNLILLLYFVAAISIFSIGGLTYMLHREAGIAQREGLRTGFAKFLAISAVISAFIVILMFYGPKGPIFYP